MIHEVILGETPGFGEYWFSQCLLQGPSLPLQKQRAPPYQLWGQSGWGRVHRAEGAVPNREEPPVPQGVPPMRTTVAGTCVVADINEKTCLAIRKG